MGTVRLQARQSFPYAGRSLAVDELFDASEKDAHLLKLVGRAVDAPKSRAIVTRDLEPESDGDTIDAPKLKRRYQRRDLVPEP